MGPLHGEITCCSPSLKMLTLSLTSDWEQKHVLHARWLNGSVSVLWKRLACICQSSDLVQCVYLCTHPCVTHTTQAHVSFMLLSETCSIAYWKMAIQLVSRISCISFTKMFLLTSPQTLR